MTDSRDRPSTSLRRLVAAFTQTPVHPQWFALARDFRQIRRHCAALKGTVLDVGCADAKPRAYLSCAAQYLGMDYYTTATTWYETKPDLFGDAQCLSFADDSIDHCLLLDVLEHIPDPERALGEIARVLKSGGTLLLRVPFLYPVHDAPLDFQRWTQFGLTRLAGKYGFRVERESALGHPVETAALNANIALSKTVLNWISRKHPLALMAILLPLFVLSSNCLAWIIAALSKSDPLMPYAYRMVWTKA
jgi:SAM-dependent methyltransferase